MSVNVRLDFNWPRNGYDVTFWREEPLQIMRFDSDGGVAWEPFDESETPAPTLHLPRGTLEALLAEAEKVIPASHATERHLKDTITVRDRMIALVELAAATNGGEA